MHPVCISRRVTHAAFRATSTVRKHSLLTDGKSTSTAGSYVSSRRGGRKEDFVCTLMTDVSIRSMVDNSLSVFTAAAYDAHRRRVATSRLRSNVNAERLDIDETVRVIERLGSDAAALKEENKARFKTLYKNAYLVAVAAGRLAASAAESSMDDEKSATNEEDINTSGDDVADGAVPREHGKGKKRAHGGTSRSEKIVPKAVHVHRMGLQSRTDRYASAVAKGQRPSPMGASSTKKQGAKSKAPSAAIV